MPNLSTAVSLSLPDWLLDHTTTCTAPIPDAQERMRWVVELSRQNVLAGSGGPFAAAVFDRDSHLLVAAGVNRVEPLGVSSAHAEVMALTFAQRRLGQFDLAAGGNHELITSAQPCLMCLGATLWSGVTRLVFGAPTVEVESILGFDEGFVPADWIAQLTRRGIEVVGEACREEAVAVLRLYREMAGNVYNSSRAGK
ncbi:MAG TPA: nucleoside deaminase [Candidatus Aminicenantes bacterium]|nr:nucleoside deaminase [Candidatus Aminicenantes bacterium]